MSIQLSVVLSMFVGPSIYPLKFSLSYFNIFWSGLVHKKKSLGYASDGFWSGEAGNGVIIKKRKFSFSLLYDKEPVLTSVEIFQSFLITHSPCFLDLIHPLG